MKKLVLLSLLIASLSTQHVCAYDFEVNGIYYTITSFEDFLVTVDGFSDTTSGIVEIPSTVTYSTRTFTINQISSAKGGSIETTIIPTTVKTIDKYAYSNTNIQYITIPNSITAIEDGTFQNCSELKSIEISPNVKEIGRWAFDGCGKLEKFIWQPNKSSIIGGYAFRNCHSLKSFTIPANLTTTGGRISIYNEYEGAFYNCSNLDSLIIEDSDSKTITFGFFEVMNGTTHGNSIGEFHGCPIKYIYLGKACKYLDVSYKKAPELYPSYMIIGDKVTSTPYMPTPADSIVIGKSFKEIDDYSRSSYTWKYIKIRQATPPSAKGFSNQVYLNTILYVPKGTKSVYESANIWKNFFNIQEYEDDEVEVETKKCAKPTIHYSNGKLSFACETEDAICQASITDTDIKSYSGNEIQLGVTYNISVYATKNGYINSEIATGTLCWVDVEPKKEGITDDIAHISAKSVLIQSDKGILTISGVDDGEKVAVYSISGQEEGTTKAHDNQATIVTNLKRGDFAIVKVGEKSIKVIMK